MLKVTVIVDKDLKQMFGILAELVEDIKNQVIVVID